MRPWQGQATNPPRTAKGTQGTSDKVGSIGTPGSDSRGQRRILGILLALTVLSRLPFLFSGYGTDQDAWRVAYVARQLWETGTYEVSRFPGFPLHEILSAPTVALGGPATSNIGSLVASLATLLVFSRTARKEAAGNLLLLGFAFTPLFWLNSSTTMDHIWSLLFVLLAYHCASRDRVVAAGLLLGIAAGFRLSSIVACAPLLLLFSLQGRDQRTHLKFLATTLLAASVAYVPVIATYGLTGWFEYCARQAQRTAPPLSLRPFLFGYRTVMAIGIPAAICLAGILVASRDRLRTLVRERDPHFLASSAFVATYLALFFVMPLDSAYLLPALPFVFFAAGRLASRGWAIAFVLAMVSFAAVNPDIVRHGDLRGEPGLNLRPGPMIEEWLGRKHHAELRSFLGGAAIGDSTIILTGFGPLLWVDNPDLEPTSALWQHDPEMPEDFGDRIFRQRSSASVLYAPALPREALEDYVARRYSCFFLGEQKAYIESLSGYTMESARVTAVDGSQ